MECRFDLPGTRFDVLVNAVEARVDNRAKRRERAEVRRKAAYALGHIDPDSDAAVGPLVNVLGDCLDGFYDKRDADTAVNAGATTVSVDGAWALTDAAAIVGNTAVPATDNGSGFTFEDTNYAGAVAPGTSAANAWWAGWTIPGSLD